MSEWIDISRPVDDTLVTWPGHARPLRTWQKRLADGDHCNLSSWQLSAHSGTHMDAPLHFVDGGASIDQIPPEVFMGECQVVDLEAAQRDVLDDNLARQHAGAKRLLIKSAHSREAAGGGYAPHPELLTESAARLLLDAGLALIGTDRLSVDSSRGGDHRLHHCLLGAGCVILEGLLLAHVDASAYRLFAAPLRLTGTEASPVRALLLMN